MNEDQSKANNLIDTTDSLEAVGVFRGWKNFLFIIILLCLLLLQASFWAANLDYVKISKQTNDKAPIIAAEKDSTASIGDVNSPVIKSETTTIIATDKKEAIEEAAKQVAAAPNQPTTVTVESQQHWLGSLKITVAQLTNAIRFLNFVLILAATLYCLTMLFSLKVSLLGRLGGINHITRAFFLSLVFIVLLLPWQVVFKGLFVGVIYTPVELLNSCADVSQKGIFAQIFHYLRFTGYWLLAVLFLIFAQIRSTRWANATLRRLEVI